MICLLPIESLLRPCIDWLNDLSLFICIFMLILYVQLSGSYTRRARPLSLPTDF